MYSENLSISAVKSTMFDKRTIVELSENQMTEIDGGTDPVNVAIVMGIVAYAAYLYFS
jgi:lactobin A/cerein 7B family class IIb bacteriocin